MSTYKSFELFIQFLHLLNIEEGNLINNENANMLPFFSQSIYYACFLKMGCTMDGHSSKKCSRRSCC